MKNNIGNKFIREICVAGATIDVMMKYSMRAKRKSRSANVNKSNDAVIKNNDRLAEKKLAREINANYNPGDFHLTLTYAGMPPTVPEAEKTIGNFIRNIKKEYEREGKEFKWHWVTEFKHKRIHHHMVLTYIDEKIIEKYWKAGHVRFTMLDRSRNYTKLAKYLIKETRETFRDPRSGIRQRWHSSRNMTKPIIKREIVEAKDMYLAPRAFKGYEIVTDSINRFEHPFTKIEHLEYMMVSTDPVPRIKTWRKGKAVKRDETYRRASEIQISWDTLDGIDFG